MNTEDVLKKVEGGHFKVEVHLENEWKSIGDLISINEKTVIVSCSDGSVEIINFDQVIFCRLIPKGDEGE